MGALDTAPEVRAEDRASWRRWLRANHETSSGVWLVSWKPSTGKARLDYDASIEEALCFGWVDGQAASIDERRSKLYFAPRKPYSTWASTNKERVARMIEAGKVAPAGLAAIERAKANGSWTVLDTVDRLEVPSELATALAAVPNARAKWDALSRSVRRELLAQIAFAKREETRARRIEAAVSAARSGIRPSRERGSPRPPRGSRASSGRRGRPSRGTRRG